MSDTCWAVVRKYPSDNCYVMEAVEAVFSSSALAEIACNRLNDHLLESTYQEKCVYDVIEVPFDEPVWLR